jgi:hypothetical protein
MPRPRTNLDVIWNAARNDIPGLAADAGRALAQRQAGKALILPKE